MNVWLELANADMLTEQWGGASSQGGRRSSTCESAAELLYDLLAPAACLQSIVRVVFHDRRLQYMEHQQLEGWRWNRPGDRILDLGDPPEPSLENVLLK